VSAAIYRATGTGRDLSTIVSMARAMHAESPRFSHTNFNPGKVAALAQRLCVENPRGAVFIAHDGGGVVGMMAGSVAEHFFGFSLTAFDFALYVRPEHRGGSVAVRLVKAFEEWARAAGAEDIALGISTGVHADRTKQLYERLGYTVVGSTHVKRLI